MVVHNNITYYETDDETNIYVEDDPNYDPNALPSLPPPPSVNSPAGMKLYLVDDRVMNYMVDDDGDDIISEMMDSYIDTTTTMTTTTMIEHGGGDNTTTTTNILLPPHEDPITETTSRSEIETGGSNTKKAVQTSSVDASKEEHVPSLDRRMKIGLSKCIKKWGICWMVVLIVAIAITGTVFMFRQYGTSVKSSSSNNEENNNGGGAAITFEFPSTTPSMTPSVSPTYVPTNSPSVSPSLIKDTGSTMDDGKKPTSTPITAIPTVAPTTATPSSSPSTELYSQIIYLLREASTTPHQFNDFTTYESRAAHWVKYNSTIDFLISNDKIIQRYTMVLLDLALHSKFTMALPSIDECEWLGVTCAVSSTTTNSGTTTVLYEPVTSIIWNNQNLTTTQIPNDIALLSNSLMHLDVSENPNIGGTIPYGLYSCTQLQYLYMYNNIQMTGNIRTEIGQLSNLKKLLLGGNAFTGYIPVELGISSLGRLLVTC